MRPIDDSESKYMVLRDLDSTYQRRIRLIVIVGSAVLILTGIAYGLFFFIVHEWLVAAFEISMMLIGIWVAMHIQGQLRLATLSMLFGMYLYISSIAMFMDIPSAVVPRSVHHYLIPLGVVSYLILKNENQWLRHGFSLACLGAVVVFSSTNMGLTDRFALPDDSHMIIMWANNIFAMGVLYLLMHVFMGDIDRMERYLHGANNRFVGLVSGMFPKAIAERLLVSGATFAERHDNCSILFADIVGFTGMTERMHPDELVKMLSGIFSRFDRCVEQSGLTKIKTMGDAYMVAAGVPEFSPHHARLLVEFGKQMLTELGDFEGIQLRIGIASGELVAGVIGQSRQIYDVWGDVVNMASRMESHGMPGRIQVSEACFALTKDYFTFEQRPGIAIKGKSGKHNVYMLCNP